MNITAINPSTEDYEKTYITSAIDDGTTALPVKNNDRFAANDRIMLGEMGQEKSEIITVASVTGNTQINVGATLYPHSADTPVYKLQFDKVRFYRSVNGSNGTYTELDTVALDVDNDTLTTIYNDTSGLSTYYYKIAFYHSLASIESSLSDPVAGSGYARNTVGRIIDEVLTEFGDDALNVVNRDELLAWANEMHDDLHGRVQRPFNFLHTREAFARVANANTLAFPTFDNGNPKMWKFDRLDYNYRDTTTDPDTNKTYALRVIGVEEFRNSYQDGTIDSTTVNDMAQVIAIDDAVNLFRYNPPSETAGTTVFYLYYWKYFTELDSDGDVVETPGTLIYKNWFRMKYYRKLGKREASYLRTATEYERSYERDVFNLQKQNRIDQGSPRGFGYRGGKTFKGFRGY